MSENENNNTPVNGGIVARTVPMLLEHEMSKSFISYAMARPPRIREMPFRAGATIR